MADKRKPILADFIKLVGDTGNGIRIEYFPVSEWQDGYSQDAYRLRINGSWHGGGSEDDSPKFLSLDAAQNVARDIKAKLLGLPARAVPAITPDEIRRGSEFSIMRPDGAQTIRLCATTAPYQNKEGDWCVSAFGYGIRRAVPLHEILEVVK